MKQWINFYPHGWIGLVVAPASTSFLVAAWPPHAEGGGGAWPVGVAVTLGDAFRLADGLAGRESAAQDWKSPAN